MSDVRPSRFRSRATKLALGVVFAGLAGAAYGEHRRAEAWECNAARRQAYSRFLEQVAHFQAAPNRDPMTDRFGPEVVVRLREPTPYDGCWLKDEWSRTEGTTDTRTVTR